MASIFDQICCDECGVKITWTPVMIGDRPYCCQDCALGLECDCASTVPGLEDNAWPVWIGDLEGGIESTYGIDYGFD